MNSDEIIPWGFQETAGNFSIKRGDYLISLGLFFGQIWRHTLQHYSSTFLCHADFIPDRSCLDVPVGRKCSACNGLAPEFLHELQSLKHFPPHYLSTVARHQDLEEEGHVGNRCAGIPIIVFDGLHMEYCITKRTSRMSRLVKSWLQT